MEDRARTGLRLVSTVVRTLALETANYERWLPARRAGIEEGSLWSTLARTIAQAIPDCCLLCLTSDDGASVTPVGVYDAEPAVIAKLGPSGACTLAATSFAADAMRRGTLHEPAVDLAAIEARSADAARMLRGLGARSLVLVPLRATGQLYGVLAVIRHHAERPPLDELDVEILEDLASHAALAISNARLVERLSNGEALRETTMFLDTVVENIPDMVFVKEAEHLTFVRMNRAGEDLLGLARGATIGKTSDDIYPASQAVEFRRTDRETLASKAMVEVMETRVETPRGPRWMHTKKVPLLDEHGAVRHLLGISRDITERKHTEARLRSAKETLEYANRELESFAYSIAHDLRAPLRAILGYGTAVLEDAPEVLAPAQRTYLERMTGAASRMATQIDELLALARIGQADLVRSRVDLAAIAHSVVGGLRQAARERVVDIAIEPGLSVHADPHMMGTVMTNLIDNAWKFTARRERAHIAIGHADDAIFVRDDGVGFDARYTDQLFGVFRRLHLQDEFPGTGIGLATVARIIHRHHGRVWAEGQRDAGATFYFTIGEAL